MSELELKRNLIGQGNTAEIFEWGSDKILKLYRHGLPDDLCVYEFEITRYAYETQKNAPKPFEIIHIDGRIGAVYERLCGKTMLKLMLSKPWHINKYSKMLAQCHITIHKNVIVQTSKTPNTSSSFVFGILCLAENLIQAERVLRKIGNPRPHLTNSK